MSDNISEVKYSSAAPIKFACGNLTVNANANVNANVNVNVCRKIATQITHPSTLNAYGSSGDCEWMPLYASISTLMAIMRIIENDALHIPNFMPSYAL